MLTPAFSSTVLLKWLILADVYGSAAYTPPSHKALASGRIGRSAVTAAARTASPFLNAWAVFSNWPASHHAATVGPACTPDKSDAVFNSIDTNADSLVTRAEMRAFVASCRLTDHPDMLFARIDANGDSLVTRDEMRSFVDAPDSSQRASSQHYLHAYAQRTSHLMEEMDGYAYNGMPPPSAPPSSDYYDYY